MARNLPGKVKQEFPRTQGGEHFQEGNGRGEAQGSCSTRGRRGVLGQGGEEGGHGGVIRSGGTLNFSSGVDEKVTHLDLLRRLGGCERAWL